MLPIPSHNLSLAPFLLPTRLEYQWSPQDSRTPAGMSTAGARSAHVANVQLKASGSGSSSMQPRSKQLKRKVVEVMQISDLRCGSRKAYQ